MRGSAVLSKEVKRARNTRNLHTDFHTKSHADGWRKEKHAQLRVLSCGALGRRRLIQKLEEEVISEGAGAGDVGLKHVLINCLHCDVS